MPDPLQDPVMIEKSKNSVSHPDTLLLSHNTPVQGASEIEKEKAEVLNSF